MSQESTVNKVLDKASKLLAYRANQTELEIEAFAETTDVSTETLLALTESGEITTLTNILNGWERKILAVISESYDVSFSNGLLDFTLKDATNPREKYVWVRHPVNKSCPDCVKLGGQIRTLAEWERTIMPGDGLTLCGGHCHCTLDKVT